MQRVPIATQEAQVTPVITQLARGEMELQIGQLKIRRTAGDDAGFGAIGRKHAAPGKEVAPQVNATPQGIAPGDSPRDRLGAALHDQHVEMILQVLANARQMMAHGDTLRCQRGGFTYTREHEQLRGLDRPGSKQHLGARPQALMHGRPIQAHTIDAHHAPVVEQ